MLNEELLTKKVENEYEIFNVRGNKFYHFMKRLEDICASFLAIVILGIPMLIIGLIVWFTSKGPMIYTSKRVGKDGKVFNFYKFRSMKHNDEEELDKLLDKNEIEGGVI